MNLIHYTALNREILLCFSKQRQLIFPSASCQIISIFLSKYEINLTFMWTIFLSDNKLKSFFVYKYDTEERFYIQ